MRAPNTGRHLEGSAAGLWTVLPRPGAAERGRGTQRPDNVSESLPCQRGHRPSPGEREGPAAFGDFGPADCWRRHRVDLADRTRTGSPNTNSTGGDTSTETDGGAESGQRAGMSLGRKSNLRGSHRIICRSTPRRDRTLVLITACGVRGWAGASTFVSAHLLDLRGGPAPLPGTALEPAYSFALARIGGRHSLPGAACPSFFRGN